MEFKLRTRVKSITLEVDESGQEVEKCVLMLTGQPHTIVSGAYLIIEFTESGRGALHVGQPLELNVSIQLPDQTVRAANRNEIQDVAQQRGGPRT